MIIQNGYQLILSCIFMIAIGTLLILFIQTKFSIRHMRLSYYIKITEIILRAFFATSNVSLPHTSRMRFALGLWIVGAVFIAAHIQTNFIAVLTKPGFENEISNQNELLQSGLNISVGIV